MLYKKSNIITMIGRWSELRVMRVRHSESKAMWVGGYCEVGGGGVPARGGAGKRIEVEEEEVGLL